MERQLGRPDSRHGKPMAKPAFSRASQIWVSMKLGNVFQFGQFRKNNDAEPMNLGVSLFSTKPRCSTSHHGTFEFTECGPLYTEFILWILRLPTTSCQPRAAHFSSYSPFSTWFPSLGRFECLRIVYPSMVNHHFVPIKIDQNCHDSAEFCILEIIKI